MLPLSSQPPPYCDRQAHGGMKPVARSPSCTCCFSHSAAVTGCVLSLSACCLSSGSSSSASVSQHSGRSQIMSSHFLPDPLRWMEINVGILRCVRPMDGHTGPLYVTNALPSASVAELPYKLCVLFWPRSYSQPLRTWWKRMSLTLIGSRLSRPCSTASPVNSLHLPIKFHIWDEIYVFQ